MTTPTMTMEEHKNIYQTIAETVTRSDTQLASEEVKKGAAKLDRIHPGWFNKINLRRFDLGDGSHCVLGQLYHGQEEYSSEGLNKIFRLKLDSYPDPNNITGELDREEKLHLLSIEHGFEAGGKTYADLEKCWVKAIKTRQDTYQKLTTT